MHVRSSSRISFRTCNASFGILFSRVALRIALLYTLSWADPGLKQEETYQYPLAFDRQRVAREHSLKRPIQLVQIGVIILYHWRFPSKVR